MRCRIERIEEKLPSTWDRATSGRLESSLLIIRNLRKISSDESSPLEKAAQSALNVYDKIHLQDEPDKDFVDLALDACGLVYVMIHKQAGSMNISRSRHDKVAKDVERIMMDVEIFVLRTLLYERHDDTVGDHQKKIEECLEKYSGEKMSSRITIRKAVVKVVADKLMDYEDMEEIESPSVRKEKWNMKMVEEITKSHVGETSNSWKTRSSSDSSTSESDQFESDVEITARNGRGKQSSKNAIGNRSETLAKAKIGLKKTAIDRFDTRQPVETLYQSRGPIETRSARNAYTDKRKKNRANTLSDPHRMRDESDEEVYQNYPPKKFPAGPHRRSTTPLPRHFPFTPQIHQATSLDATSSYCDPPIGQILAEAITSNVMSTIRNSTVLHNVGDDKSESESESLSRRTKGGNRTKR